MCVSSQSYGKSDNQISMSRAKRPDKTNKSQRRKQSSRANGKRNISATEAARSFSELLDGISYSGYHAAALVEGIGPDSLKTVPSPGPLHKKAGKELGQNRNF
jgi:hypothetical protein